MNKIDPYKHEEKYRRWKMDQKAAIPDVSKANADLIRRFIFDMELGLNVARTSKRGPRSFIRLNTLRIRMTVLARKFSARFGVDFLGDVTEEQLHTLFNEVQSGVIRKKNGEPYLAVSDFVKDFKGFWHWHQEAQRKAGKAVGDITMYLVSRPKKPKWVYLTEEQVKQLCEEAKNSYRVLMIFLLDSGVRSPTELMNIRVQDFSEDFTKVHIRDDVSKTFGRRINLLLSPAAVRRYVQSLKLGPTEAVFQISPTVTNRYLKRLAKRVFGSAVSLAGERYDRLTLYDFRHISACYWLMRYKSESALKYRFGWKQTERIHYYTELLGMRDTITEQDVLLEEDRTAIEKRLAKTESEKHVLQDRLDALQDHLLKIESLTTALVEKIN